MQRRTKWNASIVGVGLAVVLVTGACTSDRPTSTVSDPALPPASQASVEQIPQPVVVDLTVAQQSQRIDVAMPSFTEPANITNPLFPILGQESVLQLGRVDGKPFRAEVALMPDTRIIVWEGQQVETLVSQYAAFLDGRLHEVAYDYYAQADDGSVWYFGEDVFNFKGGAIINTHGTWIAGKDGPAAMIMPADPRVGDVYRPENIPGFVFEEVTVQAVDQTFEGPFGPVQGGIVIDELHMDGAREQKSFAPGYGEFYVSTGGDVEATVLALPSDALAEPIPTELATLRDGADSVLQAAGSGDWSAAEATVQELSTAWKTHGSDQVHQLLKAQMDEALATLAGAVSARNAATAQQAAIDVGRSSLDLQVPYRPIAEIELGRFDLWLAQLLLDATAGDAKGVGGDLFTLDYLRDRIQHTLESEGVTAIHAQLEKLYGAGGNLAAAAKAAEQLRSTIAQISP